MREREGSMGEIYGGRERMKDKSVWVNEREKEREYRVRVWQEERVKENREVKRERELDSFINETWNESEIFINIYIYRGR